MITGLIIGLFVGAFIGIMMMALCVASGNNDRMEEWRYENKDDSERGDS